MVPVQNMKHAGTKLVQSQACGFNTILLYSAEAHFAPNKKGVNMKMLFTALASFALLVGCGQSQEPASEAPVMPAEASAPITPIAAASLIEAMPE